MTRVTNYNEKTPKEVISWLETSREREQRIRIFYGDVETGKDWLEEFDTIGHIGRSMGIKPIPLLIKNSRSTGGGAILDHCIVRITTKDSEGDIRDVYRHPKYHLPEFRVVDTEQGQYPVKVETKDVDQQEFSEHARFKSQEQAERWVAFMKGERNSK